VDPLPDLEEIPVTCAVLATAMPLEKPCIQSVSQLFSSCGDIAFIRVVRAGSALPQDLKPLATKYPALNDSHCAWIEFETPEAAKLATELTNEDGMKVVPILPEAQKKPEKATQERKNSQSNSRKNSAANKENQHERKNSHSNNNSRKNSSTASSRKNSRQEQYNYETESPLQRQRRKAISLPITQRPNLSQLSAVVEERRSRPKSKSCTEQFPSGSSPPSTWVQRHLLAAAAASAASAAAPTVGSKPPRPSRVSQGSLTIPDGVVRFPKGPDGTRGFGARPKPVPVGAAVSS